LLHIISSVSIQRGKIDLTQSLSVITISLDDVICCLVLIILKLLKLLKSISTSSNSLISTRLVSACRVMGVTTSQQHIANLLHIISSVSIQRGKIDLTQSLSVITISLDDVDMLALQGVY
jgi:hypothetical protein